MMVDDLTTALAAREKELREMAEVVILMSVTDLSHVYSRNGAKSIKRRAAEILTTLNRKDGQDG
jgi:hypothetical protein